MLHEDGKHKNGHKPSRLEDCFLDFMLSRQAMLCTPRTMKFYRDTLGKFLDWLEEEGVIEPQLITARHVRAFLATFAERGCSVSYIHSYARSVKTFLGFFMRKNVFPSLLVFKCQELEKSACQFCPSKKFRK